MRKHNHRGIGFRTQNPVPQGTNPVARREYTPMPAFDAPQAEWDEYWSSYQGGHASAPSSSPKGAVWDHDKKMYRQPDGSFTTTYYPPGHSNYYGSKDSSGSSSYGGYSSGYGGDWGGKSWTYKRKRERGDRTATGGIDDRAQQAKGSFDGNKFVASNWSDEDTEWKPALAPGLPYNTYFVDVDKHLYKVPYAYDTVTEDIRTHEYYHIARSPKIADVVGDLDLKKLEVVRHPTSKIHYRLKGSSATDWRTFDSAPPGGPYENDDALVFYKALEEVRIDVVARRHGDVVSWRHDRENFDWITKIKNFDTHISASQKSLQLKIGMLQQAIANEKKRTTPRSFYLTEWKKELVGYERELKELGGVGIAPRLAASQIIQLGATHFDLELMQKGQLEMVRDEEFDADLISNYELFLSLLTPEQVAACAQAMWSVAENPMTPNVVKWANHLAALFHDAKPKNLNGQEGNFSVVADLNCGTTTCDKDGIHDSKNPDNGNSFRQGVAATVDEEYAMQDAKKRAEGKRTGWAADNEGPNWRDFAKNEADDGKTVIDKDYNIVLHEHQALDNQGTRTRRPKGALPQGSIPRLWHRDVSDGCVFTKRKPTASLVIDCSGSMGWDWNKLRDLMVEFPAGTIALYSGTIALYSGTNRGGRICVIAKGGYWDDPGGNRHMGANGDNYCDVEALEWLSQQPKPRVILTDFGFCSGRWGKDYHHSMEGVRDFMEEFDIVGTRQVDAAITYLRTRGRDTDGCITAEMVMNQRSYW